MRTNSVKNALKNGKTAIGTVVCDIRSPVMVQILANAGFDFVAFDCEHSGYDLQTVSNLIIGARAANAVSIVRVPHRGYEPLLTRPLDIGAQGLIVPNVQTKEEAEFVVRNVRYPPEGNRGAAFVRIHSDFSDKGAEAVMADSNENLLVMVQIESAIGVQNADAILSTPGIDAALIGPNDLSVSLGTPGRTHDEPVRRRIEEVIEVCRKNKKTFGIFVNSLSDAEYYLKKGATMLVYSADIYMLSRQAHESMEALDQLRHRISPTAS